MTNKDLLDYGLIAEFLGRLPVTVELGDLGAADLLEILTVPPDSLLKEYRELLALSGVELVVRKAALQEIVNYSIARRTGARGLRGIMEEVCHDILFEAPELKGSKIILDAATVRRKLKRLDNVEL